LDAIELQLKSGSRLRIGTDEPDRLIEAIRRCLRDNGDASSGLD